MTTSPFVFTVALYWKPASLLGVPSPSSAPQTSHMRGRGRLGQYVYGARGISLGYGSIGCPDECATLIDISVVLCLHARLRFIVLCLHARLRFIVLCHHHVPDLDSLFCATMPDLDSLFCAPMPDLDSLFCTFMPDLDSLFCATMPDLDSLFCISPGWSDMQ